MTEHLLGHKIGLTLRVSGGSRSGPFAATGYPVAVAPFGHTADSHATALEATLPARMGMTEPGEKTLGPLAMEHGAQLKADHALDLCRAALVYEGHDVPRGREEIGRPFTRRSDGTFGAPHGQRDHQREQQQDTCRCDHTRPLPV